MSKLTDKTKNIANRAYNGWMSLPGWAKGATAVGSGLVLFIIGRTIYKNAQKNKQLREANMAATYALNELVYLSDHGINPTLSDSQLEVYCQALVQAMNGCGTDEQAIYDIFSHLNNDADIRKLILVFGVRFYQPCAASQPISYAKWLFDDQSYGGGLPTWLSYDLNTSEINKINTILKSKNINYSF